MMGPAHAATGVLAGVATASALVAHGTATATTAAATLVAAALVGAGAALAPDLDHDQSTITRSAGPFTRGVAEVLEALARFAYRHTYAPHDPHPHGKVGEHRGLIHTPAFALLTGVIVALGTLVSPWVAAGTVAALGSAAMQALRWSLPSTLRRRLLLGSNLLPPLYAAAAAYGLLQAGALDQLGPWLGVIVTVGMIMHSIGDGWTNSGICFAWPIKRRCEHCAEHDRSCPGARWRKGHTLPSALRWSAGAWREKPIRWACFVLSAVAAYPTVAPVL